MALKIRLRQQGRKNRLFYRLVLTETRSPRDGKYLEQLGWYNPFETELEKTLNIQAERVEHWLNHGAEVSERAASLIKRSAPQVIEKYRQKQLARQVKLCEKRRTSKKKPEPAPKKKKKA